MFTPLLAFAAALLADPPAPQPPAHPPARAAAPPASAALAQSSRRFTLDLYREVTRDERGNIFLSPLSVQLALGPLVAGTGGETRAGLGRALAFPLTGEGLHPMLASLQRSLERDGPAATISIANALWLNRGFTPLPAFLELARGHYDARVETLDFAGDRAGAARRINAWAADETRGRIPHVVDPTMFNAATRLIVTNAVYFLADWENPFPPGSRPAPFTLADGRRIEVPMMHRMGSFRHHRGRGFAALDLPYLDPRLAMTVLLPDAPSGLAALERALTPAVLDRTLAALDRAGEADVDVKLPRVELSGNYNLTGPLTRLGMRLAFTPSADFSGLSAAPLAISGVSQFTFLKVDEEGTEAAAVTVTDVVVSGARLRRRPTEFHADRPFLFMIRDRESGAILFFGRIARPA